MANRFPQMILQRLLQELQPAPSSPPSDRTPSLEVRLKLGEVLLRASRAMGSPRPRSLALAASGDFQSEFSLPLWLQET